MDMIKHLKRNWKGLLPLLLIPAFFITFQLTNFGKFADPDGFYHAKASQFLVSGKLTGKFPWNYYTTWREGYADQHYLYHLLITPFNTYPRMHWAIITFSTLFAWLFYWLMGKFKVRWRMWWLIMLLLGSADFLARINMVKANTLSLILLGLSVLAIRNWGQAEDARTKNWYLFGLFLISAVFTWSYGGFVVVPLIILAYMAASLVVKRQWVITPMLASLFGITLGILLHPHSHNFLSLIYDQLFQTGLGAGSKIPVGQEWSPYDFVWFFKSNIVPLQLWTAALIINCWQLIQFRKWRREEVWLHGVSIGMLILTFWHRRFIEYWVPFAILAAAVVITPYLGKVKRWFLSQLVELNSHMLAGVLVIGGLTVSALAFNTLDLQRTLSGSSSYTDFRAGALAIAQDSPGQSIVLNTQWDRMPILLYWDDKDYYAVGLDPTFMYLDNSNIYWRWRDFADDWLDNLKNRDQVYNALKHTFKANYVWLEMGKNNNLEAHLSANPNYYQRLYKDTKSAVYKVK